MKKILYIEDDLGSQTLVQRLLAHAGYKVSVASRGLDGIDAAFRDVPDLILMDINLPDLSGREVTTRLRADARFKEIPIVAMTAQAQAGEREKALASGMNGYINKPIDIDALPDQVDQYLKGRRDFLAVEMQLEASRAFSQEVVARLEGKIRELEQNNAELRRVDKIKEDFIQLTAHELRTPMTLVFGYSRLLQESAVVKKLKEESADTKLFIDGLVDAIERMSSVINEIVTVSRIATGRVELAIGPVQLPKLIEAAITQYTQTMRNRNQTVSYDGRQFPNLIQVDADLLRLAMGNLISNAVKYTPDGGAIYITGKTIGTTVMITIRDTGIGIDREDQKRIFEHFYTAGDVSLHSTSKTAFRGGGLGIGLGICRGIIEAHGGRIWVESEGRDEQRLPGSTFFVELPMQARAKVQTVIG
ncbi:MAG TPA: hybrid sensor histidine kinase/response regulator [Aggregatilineales bacterium]|nr:hybrid sensor histidine kinase/response regulator [Anaerolineales bacterium]HRE49652.1 hybrid sensor histidine kinase/response regulator [Aggregatilineales bacterium]